MKKTLTNTWNVVMVALVVLSGGLLSSCGVEGTHPLATVPKSEMGLGGPSSGDVNTSVSTPVVSESKGEGDRGPFSTRCQHQRGHAQV